MDTEASRSQRESGGAEAGPGRSSILIVDDMPENLAILFELLRTTYHVRGANSGREALRVAAGDPKPDLILLDVMMPGMDGYEVLSRLRENEATRRIPVVFLTAMSDPDDEVRGLRMGAADYITKPIKPDVVLARVRTQIEAKWARDWLADQNSLLEAEVSRRMAENELVQDVGIRALAYLAETRDPETGLHIKRTQGYVRLLAQRLQHHARFEPFLDRATIDLLVKSAPLHDIGKVGIPDHILLKPGKLTPGEWEVMKTHARLGYDAIEHALTDAERPVAFLTLAKEIARWHHEKWDGSGYPDGLAGNDIPVSARLMALADVFDALITRRVYKPAFPLERAREIIAEGRGTHFDPDVAAAFLADFDAFVAVAHRYREPGTPGALDATARS